MSEYFAAGPDAGDLGGEDNTKGPWTPEGRSFGTMRSKPCGWCLNDAGRLQKTKSCAPSLLRMEQGTGQRLQSVFQADPASLAGYGKCKMTERLWYRRVVVASKPHTTTALRLASKKYCFCFFGVRLPSMSTFPRGRVLDVGKRLATTSMLATYCKMEPGLVVTTSI